MGFDGFLPNTHYGRGPYGVFFDDGVVVRFPTPEQASAYKRDCDALLKEEQLRSRDNGTKYPHA